ncbi:MAG: NfeD family protein [Methylococcaceae bacterium]|nr:NfeD family protein [Methylococcaceae bacterium]
MNEMIFIFWYWWVLALIFLVVEILAPGFFFLWMAASGFATGIMVWLMPSVSMNIQFFVFSTLSIIAILVWKFYIKKYVTTTDQPLLNKRGAQYIGRVFTLYQAIENGQGKIKVDDSIWKVRGEDCNINTRVKVIAIRGIVFDVEKVD